MSIVVKRETSLYLFVPGTVFLDLFEFLDSFEGKKLSVSIGIKTMSYSRALALHIPIVFVKKKVLF